MRGVILKVDWHYLCVEMMLDYIPQEIATWDNYNKYQEFYDHFISISTVLGARKKTEHGTCNLMIGDDEYIDKTAHIMKRSVKQCFEFAKHQREENKTILAATLQKCEKIQENSKLNASQRTFLEQRIQELRLMLESD